MTSVQYPGSGPTWLPVTGPNLGWAFDNMGRLNTMTDLAASSTIISGATYGPSNELLTMSGLLNESRSYNSMLQLTGLTSGSTVSMTYGYSSTQNNGKITSQTDAISGETVQYTYDALNRLASATATNSSWGQSYAYDGFGNLTDQNETAGSAPQWHTSYDPSTNHGACVDANGNNTCAVDDAGHGFTYDVENRPSRLSNGAVLYSYAPGNKRVWRGLFTNGSISTDEVTFWGVTGQKLAVYQLTYTNLTTPPTQANWVWYASQTGTNYYFGSKLIKNATGYVGKDRLGSIGKFYPWGQEKQATTDGTEKFTGYFRDSDTGLDYAMNRYHNPGTGRFMTPDPSNGSMDPKTPLSWNRYGYVLGDPINLVDKTGLATLDASGTCELGDPSDPECDTGDDGGGGSGAGDTGGGDTGTDPTTVSPGASTTGCAVDGFDVPCILAQLGLDSGSGYLPGAGGAIVLDSLGLGVCAGTGVCEVAGVIIAAGTLGYGVYELLTWFENVLEKSAVPSLKDMQSCTPLGPPIAEKGRTIPGTTSYVQKFACPDGKVYEIHWIEKDKTGTIKHGPHPRPGR